MSRKTRKLIWSAPLVAVLAVAGALALFAALAPGAALAEHEARPGAPTNLLAKAADGIVGRTTMAVSWTAPSGTVDGYRIDVSSDNITWMELEANTGNADTTYMHTGLDPNQARVYRVFALNSAGTGLVSNTSQGRTSGTAMPDDVIGLTATPNGWHKIDLSWTAPYGGGNDIDHYCIEVATPIVVFPTGGNGCAVGTSETAAPDNAGAFITSGPGTSYTHKDLDAGTTRLYRVYAITGTGATDISEEPSNIATARTALAVDPIAPDGLTLAKSQPIATGQANAGVNETVDLYWYWPSSNGGVPITSFRVEVTTDRNNWPSSTDTAASNDDIDLTDDPPDVNAVFNVTADNAQSTTNAYQAQHTHGVVVRNDADVLQATTLYYRVFTETDEDTTNAVTVQDMRRSSPTGIGAIIVNGGEHPVTPNFVAENVDPVGTSRIELEWEAGEYDPADDDPDAGDIDYPGSGYRIDYALGNGTTGTQTGETGDNLEWKLLWPHTNFTSPEFTHKNLDPETEVFYRIFTFGPSQTISPAGTPRSGITEPAGDLGKIRNLTATANGAVEINVSWDHPAETDVADIDRYVVEISRLSDTVWETATTKDTMGPATAFRHGMLTEKSTWRYRIAVAATAAFTPDAGNAEHWSRYAIATTDSAGKPNAPIGLVAEDARDSNLTNPGDRGITLVWNMPEGPAGSDVESYRVERQVVGEESAYNSLTANTNSKRTAYTDFDEPDLAMGEVRMYRVAAIGADGVVGEWAEVRFPADTSHEPVVGPEVGPATGVTTGPFNEGGVIQVNWDAAPNATGYIIYAVNVDELDDPDGQIVVEPVNDAAAETINLGGLNVGDTYDIYVVATAKEMVAWPAAAAVQVTAN